MATYEQQVEDLKEKIANTGIENVRFEFLDLNAIARSKTIPSRHFKKTATSGILFPVPIFACDSRTGIAVESNIVKKYLYSDMLCHPDLSTFTILPWVPNTARVFISGTSTFDGKQVLVDPRNILQSQLACLKKKGLSIFSSFEYEFWVKDEKSGRLLVDGIDAFSTLRLAKHQPFFDKVARNLFRAGVDVECVETEYAKGQFEIPMEPSFGIRSADNAATFRIGIKEMAMQEGFIASFMSKPYPDEEGASGHLNHSLWTLDGATSLVSDHSRPHGLSEIGEHWVAGFMEHAPALSFLQSPTLSCRDRFKPGTFSPFNVTWGVDNRSCAFRLKTTGSHGAYIEDRLGSSAGNPYVSLAALIAAGIDGIDRKLPLPAPIPFGKSSDDEASAPNGTVFLPADLESAIKSLKDDQVMMTTFGTDFVDSLECIRRNEEEKVTNIKSQHEDWRNLYFENI